MFYALTFLAVGALWFYQATTSPVWWLTFLLCNVGLSFALVGLGFALSVSCGYGSTYASQIFGKKANGKRKWWIYPIHWSFFILNGMIFHLHHWRSKENWCDEVFPQVWIGRLPIKQDQKAWSELAVQGVVDATAEFMVQDYIKEEQLLCIPTFDETPPSLEDLKEASAWIEEKRKLGPVYVHCAYGHGRSATIVAAWLLTYGHCQSVKEAEDLMKEKRPKVRLNSWHKKALEELQ